MESGQDIEERQQRDGQLTKWGEHVEDLEIRFTCYFVDILWFNSRGI